MNYIRCYRR